MSNFPLGTFASFLWSTSQDIRGQEICDITMVMSMNPPVSSGSSLTSFDGFYSCWPFAFIVIHFYWGSMKYVLRAQLVPTQIFSQGYNYFLWIGLTELFQWWGSISAQPYSKFVCLQLLKEVCLALASPWQVLSSWLMSHTSVTAMETEAEVTKVPCILLSLGPLTEAWTLKLPAQWLYVRFPNWGLSLWCCDVEEEGGWIAWVLSSITTRCSDNPGEVEKYLPPYVAPASWGNQIHESLYSKTLRVKWSTKGKGLDT